MVEGIGGELDWKGMCNEKALSHISAVCSSFGSEKAQIMSKIYFIVVLRN